MKLERTIGFLVILTAGCVCAFPANLEDNIYYPSRVDADRPSGLWRPGPISEDIPPPGPEQLKNREKEISLVPKHLSGPPQPPQQLELPQRLPTLMIMGPPEPLTLGSHAKPNKQASEPTYLPKVIPPPVVLEKEESNILPSNMIVPIRDPTVVKPSQPLEPVEHEISEPKKQPFELIHRPSVGYQQNSQDKLRPTPSRPLRPAVQPFETVVNHPEAISRPNKSPQFGHQVESASKVPQVSIEHQEAIYPTAISDTEAKYPTADYITPKYPFGYVTPKIISSNNKV